MGRPKEQGPTGSITNRLTQMSREGMAIARIAPDGEAQTAGKEETPWQAPETDEGKSEKVEEQQQHTELQKTRREAGRSIFRTKYQACR